MAEWSGFWALERNFWVRSLLLPLNSLVLSVDGCVRGLKFAQPEANRLEQCLVVPLAQFSDDFCHCAVRKAQDLSENLL